MTDEKLAEKMSALFDDELGHTETLKLWKQMESDENLREQWNRYNRTSGLLTRRSGVIPDAGFTARVSAAIASEPTVLAPRAMRQRIVEKVTSTALAASIALAAVVVGQSLVDHASVNGAQLVAEARYAPVPAEAGMATLDPDFQNYLVLHNETAYLAGAQGLMPYARVVSAQSAR